jgi:hypothetical protein
VLLTVVSLLQLIVVVGGFGCNTFLQVEMRSRFAHRVFFTGEDG